MPKNKIIKRKKYLDKINQFKDKQIIKVIIGQRRIGKSFLLKQLIQELKQKKIAEKNIIYLNKENLEFDFIKDYQDLNNYLQEKIKKSNQSKKIYLIIDEVQEIKNFEKTIRSYALDDKFDIYISGSNSKIISSELSTFLSGRYIEIYVSPLDYKEFLLFHNLKNNQNTLEKYFKYGGMPFLRNLELNNEQVFTYNKNIYNTILLKDIVQRFEIRNIDLLEKLIVFLSNNIGYIFSANSISKYLKNQKINVVPSIIIDYLEALQSSYFIQKVKRFDLKGKKVFKSNAKFYFNDLGIRNSIVGFDKSIINQIIENIVYLHLLSNDYKVYVGVLDDKEVDFIALKNEKVIYIQVALTIADKKVFAREFGNLVNIKDNHEKIVISMDSLVKDWQGIKQLRLDDFLMNFD